MTFFKKPAPPPAPLKPIDVRPAEPQYPSMQNERTSYPNREPITHRRRILPGASELDPFGAIAPSSRDVPARS